MIGRSAGFVVAALILAGSLAGCGSTQPSESQTQIAVSNCFVILSEDMDESAAVLECSNELGRIGDRAFVEKYRSE